MWCLSQIPTPTSSQNEIYNKIVKYYKKSLVLSWAASLGRTDAVVVLAQVFSNKNC